MRPLKPTRIGRRLLGRLLLLSSLLVLVLAIAQTILFYRQSLGEFDESLRIIREGWAPSLSKSVEDLNDERLALELEGLLRLPHVGYAAVFAADDVRLAEAGRHRDRDAPVRDLSLPGPAGAPGTSPGWLRVQADRTGILNEALWNAFVNVVFHTALVVFLSVMLYLLFESMVARHLFKMAGYFHSFELGRGNQRLYLDRRQRLNDELDTLADSVNAMREQLGTSLRSLSENRQLLEDILNAVPQSISWKDQNSVYLGCNYAFARDAGLHERADVAGRTDFDLPWRAEEALAFRREDYETMDTGKPGRRVVEQQLRADGTSAWIETTRLPMLDESGKVRGVLSVYEDISERKKAKEELLEIKEAAEAASRSKSEFLANMSHEIRTPLNGLMGMLQLLGLTGMDEKQGTYLNAAINSARRLTRLLSDILDLSRIEAGKLIIEEGEFELAGVRESVLDIFTETAIRRGLWLDFVIHEGLPERLVGDENRLRQILFNLVGNAVKFTEKGSVIVEASLLRRQAHRAWVLFSVSDTGIGIPEDMLRAIFDPFVQAEGAYAKRFQGAGLGLSIVRKLADLLGGSLTLDSEPGVGTTVYISLPFGASGPSALEAAAPRAAAEFSSAAQDAPPPAASPARAQDSTAPDAPPAKACGLRILLAEDDAVNLLYGTQALTQAGHAVTPARNGQDVLDLLATGEFDLILMDIQMPVMDGVAATRAIRESTSLGHKARIPIIAMTAYSMARDQEEFLAVGMDGYLPKPVEAEALAAMTARIAAAREPARGKDPAAGPDGSEAGTPFARPGAAG